jgi:hypothetical protein
MTKVMTSGNLALEIGGAEILSDGGGGPYLGPATYSETSPSEIVGRDGAAYRLRATNRGDRPLHLIGLVTNYPGFFWYSTPLEGQRLEPGELREFWGLDLNGLNTSVLAETAGVEFTILVATETPPGRGDPLASPTSVRDLIVNPPPGTHFARVNILIPESEAR